MTYFWNIFKKTKTTKPRIIIATPWHCFKTAIKYGQYMSAWRILWNGPSSFDTLNGKHFWTFKKGFHHDYSQERIDNGIVRNPNPHEGWNVDSMVKLEGAPVPQAPIEELPILGYWWSIQFQCGPFLTRFRYRSWTKNVFYITWGGF